MAEESFPREIYNPTYSKGISAKDLADKLGFTWDEFISKTKTLSTRHLKLQFLDYGVLAAFFIISVGIGVVLGYRSDQKAKKEGANKNEKLTGGRTLTAVPVALSCTASFMSAITILGTPVEIFNYGTMYYYSALTYFLVACIVAFIFLPVMYPLNLSNGYIYFVKRFRTPVIEKIASSGFLLSNMLYMGIVTYSPALAL